jgi:hypothetical protein
VEAEPLPASVAEAMRKRMVENARRSRDTGAGGESLQARSVIDAVYDDLVVMQNQWKLTQLPITSPRRLSGSAIVRGRRLLQRSLHPLPAAQTDFNLAVNRIVSHLLNVTAKQAATIERLESRIDELTVRSNRR